MGGLSSDEHPRGQHQGEADAIEMSHVESLLDRSAHPIREGDQRRSACSGPLTEVEGRQPGTDASGPANRALPGQDAAGREPARDVRQRPEHVGDRVHAHQDADSLDRHAGCRERGEGDGALECVPEELNQVLTNLVQNAIEAAPDGAGHVRVAGSVDGERLVLSVRDNGPGIPPEIRTLPPAAAGLLVEFQATSEEDRAVIEARAQAIAVEQSVEMPIEAIDDLLKQIKSMLPRTEVAVITGHGSIESAVEAMKLGAYDYITKPFGAGQLKLVLQRMKEKSPNKVFIRNSHEKTIGIPHSRIIPAPYMGHCCFNASTSSGWNSM